MIRVLQVVNNMQRAGLETVIMNYYREIDRTKIQFDFLTHRPGPSAFDAEIERLGGHIYKMPRLYPNNYVSYFKKMSKFFSEHPEYKIVHSHIDSMSFLPLLAAKRAGIPIRIAHSHNTSMDIDFKMPLKQLFKLGIPSVANQYFACGKDAGHFLFGDREFFVMKNSIDVQHFIFSEHKRIQVRKKMEIADNTLIIGNVGRLSYQKNQEFLLRAFNILVKKRKNVKLWLIGEGENEQRLLKMIKQLKIEKYVSMLGTRADVAELYQAMDLFVLPSRFEGIPMVGIEAQSAGLPCLFSDAVSDETIYSSLASKLPLRPDMWAKKMDMPIIPSANRKIRNFGGYDIHSSYKVLENKYKYLNEISGDAVQ